MGPFEAASPLRHEASQERKKKNKQDKQSTCDVILRRFRLMSIPQGLS